MRTCGHHFRLRLLPALSLLCASGLTAQPAHLVKDIDDTTRDGGVFIQEMSAFGPSVYFGASALSSFEQLWKSDGTTQGTWKLRDFDVVGSSQPHRFTRTASKLFFFVGPVLWRLNAAGDASPVKELPTEPAEIAVLGDTLIMAMGDREVWRSDGTPAGTFRVANLAGAVLPVRAHERRWFRLLLRARLRRGDCSHVAHRRHGGGTRSQVELGLSASGPRRLSATRSSSSLTRGFGDRPYTLSRSDWDGAGHDADRVVRRRCGGRLPVVLPSVRAVGFHASRRPPLLHRQRGRARARALGEPTAPRRGPSSSEDVNPGPDAGLEFGLLAAGDRIFFAGHDAEHGTEVWVSNGTAAGTALVTGPHPWPGVEPELSRTALIGSPGRSSRAGPPASCGSRTAAPAARRPSSTCIRSHRAPYAVHRRWPAARSSSLRWRAGRSSGGPTARLGGDAARRGVPRRKRRVPEPAARTAAASCHVLALRRLERPGRVLYGDLWSSDGTGCRHVARAQRLRRNRRDEGPRRRAVLRGGRRGRRPRVSGGPTARPEGRF